jgi:hypothetical protein
MVMSLQVPLNVGKFFSLGIWWLLEDWVSWSFIVQRVHVNKACYAKKQLQRLSLW